MRLTGNATHLKSQGSLVDRTNVLYSTYFFPLCVIIYVRISTSSFGLLFETQLEYGISHREAVALFTSLTIYIFNTPYITSIVFYDLCLCSPCALHIISFLQFFLCVCVALVAFYSFLSLREKKWKKWRIKKTRTRRIKRTATNSFQALDRYTR